jgi:hypothetical protein
MAYSAEIRDANRKYLTNLVMTKLLGGDIDDAITSQRASMEPEDVASVMNEIDKRKNEKNSSKQ